MVSINRILCPIDFSEFSLDALRHGLALARWYSAQMTLFHVYQVSQPLPVERDRRQIEPVPPERAGYPNTAERDTTAVREPMTTVADASAG